MAGTRDRGDPPRRDQGLTPAPDDRIAAAHDSLAAAFREESSPVFAAAGGLTVLTVATAWLAALRHEQLAPGLLVRASPGPP
jgi:hypothetical protein